MTDSLISPVMSRRALLRAGSSALAVAAIVPRAVAQEDPGAPFDFDWLVARARDLAAEDFAAPEPLAAPFDTLDYDAYRMIRFRESHALWAGRGNGPVVQAYHPGWLFDATVDLHDVEDGRARPVTFTASDFIFGSELSETLSPETPLPGVAGFRLNAPLNVPDRLDEVVSFLGASYFRALGRGNRYGLSARGLAINTAIGGEEEFPRFTSFWLERPAPDSDAVTISALLDSPSVTGAYRFVLTPGDTTVMDVTLRLFFRRDVEQVGIAPLTSMFLFGPSDEGPFRDYRLKVHDSEALVIDLGETTYLRPLNNPPRLANSYFGALSPRSFGLVQRHRAFEDYLDTGAHYELRPALMVEPVEDWGRGTVRLIEIPSDLEANDNIVAFWIPDRDFSAGDEWGTSYKLHWGMDPVPDETDLAKVLRTLTGFGGVAGVEPRTDRQKFVIDFAGGELGELSDGVEVNADTSASGGDVVESVLERVRGVSGDFWRLVLEVSAKGDAVVEMTATLSTEDRPLSETWVYQWLKES